MMMTTVIIFQTPVDTPVGAVSTLGEMGKLLPGTHKLFIVGHLENIMFLFVVLNLKLR